jgi:hypothetical protein
MCMTIQERPPSYPELREEERRRQAKIDTLEALREQLGREIAELRAREVVIVRKEPGA